MESSLSISWRSLRYYYVSNPDGPTVEETFRASCLSATRTIRVQVNVFVYASSSALLLKSVLPVLGRMT